MKKQVVAILTNFQDFNPGYSLSGIVVDQCYMLLRRGHTVHLFVNEHYNPGYDRDSRLKKLRRKYKGQLFVHKKTKFMHLVDYQTKANFSDEHKQAAEEAGKIYAAMIEEFEIGAIYTHDYIFTGWSLPYAVAVQEASKILIKKKCLTMWYHWVHSVPSKRRDWWSMRDYGDNHRIIFPNQTEIVRVAEMFECPIRQVISIPHIKDPRSYYDFGDDAMNFTERFPKIMSSEIVQVYPIGTDRMFAKQIDLVISIFGYLKKANMRVFLCIANQWATGRQRKESVYKYIKMAEGEGLVPWDDFVFTSEIIDSEYEDSIDSCKSIEDLQNCLETINSVELTDHKVAWDAFEIDAAKEEVKKLFRPYEVGISRRMLRELQLLQSIFIFPTLEESFGLVGPEAAYSGAFVVANRSLSMMQEVLGKMCASYDFGSHHHACPETKNPDYQGAIANALIGRFLTNEIAMTKTYCRTRYNMDAMYDLYYAPHSL